MAALKKLAESFKQAQGEDAAAAGEDDDEIPDLVESFDKAEIQEEKKEESSA
jgi:nascent polypeptide-associated complex subunit beta